MAKFVMVLNDGRYSDLDGCAIVAVPDHLSPSEVPDFVAQADGYYCFTSQVDFESNNGMEQDELDYADQFKQYTKCGGCGEMFNLNSGFERIMAAQHECNEISAHWHTMEQAED